MHYKAAGSNFGCIQIYGISGRSKKYRYGGSCQVADSNWTARGASSYCHQEPIKKSTAGQLRSHTFSSTSIGFYFYSIRRLKNVFGHSVRSLDVSETQGDETGLFYPPNPVCTCRAVTALKAAP